MQSKKVGFNSVDEYIASFPEEVQKILEEIRATIKAAAPEAQEKISYQIAAFELNGKNLVYFAGWKNHISIYPIPPGSEAFNKEISRYVDGKGTLKFPLNEAMPFELIGKVVKLHVAENLKQAAIKSGKRK
ncbi:MAG: DUF1801 domain-containing protein [Anaerolineales bacterium]|nr:DUF1801 domain-containing protein [Anaerolineales bacterium]